MKRVFKYPLIYTEIVQLTLPMGAEFLHLGMQRGVPTLWALIDVDEERTEHRTLRFAGTGHPIEERIGVHIGSTIDEDLGLVWHLFEIREEN